MKIMKGLNTNPFDFSFNVNKDKVKKIYFKYGTIYIWDTDINSSMSIEESLKNLEKNLCQ